MTFRQRVIHHLKWRLFGSPADPARRWHGITPDGLPMIRIARYGDCTYREMSCSHGVHNPVGHPRYAVDRLVERGIGVEYSDRFLPQFVDLPATADQLVEHLKLSGPPDVVLVQTGTAHFMRTRIPNGPRIGGLRDNIMRATGSFAPSLYRVIHPAMRVLGRVESPYRGCAELVSFVAAVRQLWPDARIGVIGPYPPREGVYDRRVALRIRADLAQLSAKCGVCFIDPWEPLHQNGDAVYGANGHNLNARGSEIVGGLVADWVASVTKGPAVQARAAAYAAEP